MNECILLVTSAFEQTLLLSTTNSGGISCEKWPKEYALLQRRITLNGHHSSLKMDARAGWPPLSDGHLNKENGPLHPHFLMLVGPNTGRNANGKPVDRVPCRVVHETVPTSTCKLCFVGLEKGDQCAHMPNQPL